MTVKRYEAPPPSDRERNPPPDIECSRCGHVGQCWVIEEPSLYQWKWKRVTICFMCIAHAGLEAA